MKRSSCLQRIGIPLVAAVVTYVPYQANAGSPFESELARLGGRAAKQCGLVPIGHDAKSAWRCVGDAERKGEAFWFALQQQGIDSEVWIAAIRTPSGAHLILDYDSNVDGGPGLKPRFYQKNCPHRILYRPAEQPPLKCEHG